MRKYRPKEGKELPDFRSQICVGADIFVSVNFRIILLSESLDLANMDILVLCYFVLQYHIVFYAMLNVPLWNANEISFLGLFPQPRVHKAVCSVSPFPTTGLLSSFPFPNKFLMTLNIK